MPSRQMGPATEDAHQVALFEWAAMNEKRYPDLRKLYAIPNGGERNKIVAAKLKAQGVRAGVLDISLDVARHGFHGLRIELKRPGNVALGQKPGRCSPEQNQRISDLVDDGYKVAVCFGWEPARDVLVEYLS